jgi:hypothetical protein
MWSAVRRGRTALGVLAASLAVAWALLAPSAGTAATAPVCPPKGRTLLLCSERGPAFKDDVTWSHAFVLDTELFETKLPLPLGNPALRQFWLFEMSTAAARAIYQNQFASNFSDVNFEQIATVQKLSRPAVHRHGIVSRKMARALSRLMQAEQAEVLDLQALVTSLNRATAASFLANRKDWVKWQMAAAARFARYVANDLDRVISAERGATRALAKKRLLFGVGSTDLTLGQRKVRKQGLAPSVTTALSRWGLTPYFKLLTTNFLGTNFGPTSFALSKFISQTAPTVTFQRGFQSALRSFAARIPPASKPPS